MNQKNLNKSVIIKENMTLSEVIQLINTLEEENKTNTDEEREYNIEWIKQLRISIDKALDKRFEKDRKKHKS